MKDGFITVKEILKEVAKEENLTWTEIEDLWMHQKNYIDSKKEEEEIYAIYIPYIGTLSLNVRQFKKEIKYKNRKFYKKFIEKVKILEEKENYGKFANSHKKKTATYRLLIKLIKKFNLTDTRKEFYKRENWWKILSKYSNKLY